MKLPVDTVWDFRITHAKFGIGALDEIGYETKILGGSKVLIITDKGISRAGLTDNLIKILEENKLNYEVWDEVEAEPSLRSIDYAIEFSRDKKTDLIIGLGGGSSIDTAKIVNLISTSGGEILDYVAPPTGQGKRVLKPLMPLIAVPTTAGTGSETSPASVISLPEKEIKVGISSNLIRPNLAILDPLLTITMPPKITANTGMDALTHAIESYTTRRYDEKNKPKTPSERPNYGGATIVTDTFAEKAIFLTGKHLRKAVFQGNNIEARSGMLLASFMAGAAFTNAGVGAVHASAYPVGGYYHTPHGLTNAILLPAVMEYNLPYNYERFAKIADLLGEEIKGKSISEAAEKSVEAVKKLSKDIGIPSGLMELGVKKEEIPNLADDCMKIQRLLVCNPRPLSKKDMEKIYQKAIKY
jgi:alcohol dehydrogenase class IV